MRFTFFKDIITAITTLVGSDFSTIELDRNQLEETEGLKSLLLPCLFVQFEDGIEFVADTHRYKAELVDIKLTIATQSVGDTIHPLIDTLVSKLTDKIPMVGDDAIGQSLRLNKIELDHSKDGLDIAEVYYQTTMTRLRDDTDPNKVKIKSKITKTKLK